MKPGDRKRRWKRGSAIEAIIFFGLALLFIIFVEGPAKWFFVIGFIAMALLAVRDNHRGWKMRYDLPPWGKRAIERGDKTAIAAWEDTQRDAKDPNRKRYSFDNRR